MIRARVHREKPVLFLLALILIYSGSKVEINSYLHASLHQDIMYAINTNPSVFPKLRHYHHRG